jgi:zinc protease
MLTPRLRRRASPRAIVLAVMLLIVPFLGDRIATAAIQAKSFRLDNGLQVVVVPDYRAQLVTHSVWYRAGSAEDPPSQSGLAHFLEHLMFRDAETHGAGEFSKIVARLGGQDEGVTQFDTTYYYQNIARPHLSQVMKLEAQRMARLQLDDKAVNAEREVVLIELYSDKIEHVFEDQMRAVLYFPHPYKTPTIGWKHEVASLSRDQALAFYRRFYAPNNAIVVVVGNVTVNEVKALAAETYGRLPASPNVFTYHRPREPEPRAARRIELRDPRVGRPRFQRLYLAPSYKTAQPGEAEALALLMNIVAEGPNSRLYRTLVIDQKVASGTSGAYVGEPRDYGEISISAIPASGRSLTDVEAAVDSVLLAVLQNGIFAEELERAKRRATANFLYDSDNQQTLAERYGGKLIIGMTIADVEAWPDRIAKVAIADLAMAAKKYLDIRRSVAGFLRPPVGLQTEKNDEKNSE